MLEAIRFFGFFAIVIFLYLHIAAHYRKNEDLEIFETDYTTTAELQQECDRLHPLVILLPTRPRELPTRMRLLDGNEEYDANVTFLGDAGRRRREPMRRIQTAISAHDSPGILSEKNREWMEEADVWSRVQKWGDDHFQPSYTAYRTCDVWMASKGTCSPLRAHTAYRHYIVPRGGGGGAGIATGVGPVVVRLTPWKSRKWLAPKWDADPGRLEYTSDLAAFGGRADQAADFARVKFLDVVLPEGRALSIPPYWWYSVQFPGPEVVVYSFQYWSCMSLLANIPMWTPSLVDFWSKGGLSDFVAAPASLSVSQFWPLGSGSMSPISNELVMDSDAATVPDATPPTNEIFPMPELLTIREDPLPGSTTTINADSHDTIPNTDIQQSAVDLD
jgi:hypothetical protein